MSELPEGWTLARICDVSEVNPPLRGDIPVDAMVSFVPMASVQAETGALDASDARPFGELRTKSYRHFAEGDVLFAKITPCMENGKIALARNLVNGRGFGSTEFHVLRPHRAIEAPFLMHYLLQRDFRRRAARNMKGTAGQLRVPAAYLSGQVIPLPPPAEQERIVAAIEEQFSRLDAGVAALERVRENLRRMRAAVLQAAVTGRLLPSVEVCARVDDAPRTDATASRLTGENARKVARAYADLRERTWQIPETWHWRPAAEMCSLITNGDTPPPADMTPGEGDIPYIKVYNLADRGILDFSVRPTFVARSTHEGPLKRSRLLPGDVLTNIVGPPLGKVSVVPDTYPEWNTNQAVVVFRTLPTLHHQLLKYWLLSPPILGLLESTSRATAGQFNVSLTTCRALPLPVPPIDEQVAIVATVDEQLSVLNSQESVVDGAIRRAEALRSSILCAAFSGQLVPQDPSDEPASVLLDRIAAERAASGPNGRRPTWKPHQERLPL